MVAGPITEYTLLEARTITLYLNSQLTPLPTRKHKAQVDLTSNITKSTRTI